MKSSLRTLGLLAAVVVAMAACSLNDPTTPTQPSGLTGQNPNVAGTFNGTIRLSGAAQGTADGKTDVFLSATVNDLDGNPTANGTPINISTNFGTLRMLGTDPAGATTSVRALVFNGSVTVALRSAAVGTATVSAWIGDVARNMTVEFQSVSTNLFANLIFVSGTSGSVTVQGTAPLTSTLESTVVDADGDPVAGVTVRFRIIDDSTAGAVAGPAQIVGSGSVLTNTAGKASSLLKIEGVGTVIVVSDVMSKNKVVATSNQVIAHTTTVGETIGMNLTVGTGGTVQNVTAGTSTQLRVAVKDQKSGQLLSGRKIRFTVVSDSATAEAAELATTGITFTDGNGVATNSITARERNSTVVVVAELLNIDNRVEALSNQVVITVTQNIALTLTVGGGATVQDLTAPGTAGIEVSAKDGATSAALSGQRILFVIVSDTSGGAKATLANTQPTLTNGSGVATNAVTATVAGSQVVIVARLLGPGDRVDGESNQVIVNVK